MCLQLSFLVEPYVGTSVLIKFSTYFAMNSTTSYSSPTYTLSPGLSEQSGMVSATKIWGITAFGLGVIKKYSQTQTFDSSNGVLEGLLSKEDLNIYNKEIFQVCATINFVRSIKCKNIVLLNYTGDKTRILVSYIARIPLFN